jgi:hypothetical protein
MGFFFIEKIPNRLLIFSNIEGDVIRVTYDNLSFTDEITLTYDKRAKGEDADIIKRFKPAALKIEAMLKNAVI